MTLDQLLNRPALLIRRTSSGAVNDYGDEVPTVTYELTVAEIQQRRRDEPGTEGEFSVGEWTGFFPAGTSLDTSDAIVVYGFGVFELVGAPWPARNPRTQTESHVEASLKLTEGAEDLTVTITVTATETRMSGDAVVEEGFVGFAQSTVPEGDTYLLLIEGDQDIDLIVGAVIGDYVDVDPVTLVLTLETSGTPVGQRRLGQVTALPDVSTMTVHISPQ